MKTPNLLLLSWSHVALLSVLRALGPRFAPLSVACCLEAGVVGRSRHVRKWHRIGADWPDERLLDCLREIVVREGVDLVVANDEGSVDFLARQRDALAGLVRTTPVAEAATLARVRDKRAFMRLAAELGLPHPRSVLDEEVGAEGGLPTDLRFPVVVKPANLTCGFGVQRCTTPAEAQAAIASLRAERRPFLVQEFFPGNDLDFCLVAEAGRIVRWTTRMNVGAKRRFGAPGQDWRLERLPQLLPPMERLVAHLRWSGALDVDCLYQPATGEWRVLECNTRFGATTLADASAGVNLPEALVLLGLGQPVPPAECRPQPYYTGGWGLRQVLGLATGPRYRLHETYLPHVLRDPLPELVAGTQARFCGR